MHYLITLEGETPLHRGETEEHAQQRVLERLTRAVETRSRRLVADVLTKEFTVVGTDTLVYYTDATRRLRITDLLKKTPGLTMQEMSWSLNWVLSTVRHYLYRMIDDGEVVVKRPASNERGRKHSRDQRFFLPHQLKKES